MNTSERIVAARGHVYLADPNTEPFDIKKFVFSRTSAPGTGWSWLGDHSAENLPAVDSEGGDATVLRTWDEEATDVTREAMTHTITLNVANVSPATLLAIFPGSVESTEGGYVTLPAAGGSRKQAVLIVIENGTRVAALYFPNVDLAGSFPSLSLDQYTEIPVNGSVLAGSGGVLQRIYKPVTRTV